MKYLKITVFLFTAVIGLTACGVIRKKPVPSFQPKDTVAISEIETVSTTENESHDDGLPDDPMFDRMEDRCKEIVSLYHALYESAEKTVPTSQWEYPLLSQDSIDSIENLLYNAGFDVIDPLHAVSGAIPMPQGNHAGDPGSTGTLHRDSALSVPALCPGGFELC